MSALSVVRKYTGTAILFVRPIIYLWPWALGVVVFAAVVGTPQGVVLAERYRSSPAPFYVVTFCLGASWLTVVLACLLALLVSAVRTPDRPNGNPDSCLNARVRVFAGGLWTLAVASAYGVLFARVIQRGSVWVTVAALALAATAGIFWMTSAICNASSAASRARAGVRRHHLLVVSLALLLSIAPLVGGALVVRSSPNQLADAGPLLVVMVGIASLSTLAGVIIVVIPVYLRRPWIGLVYVAGMMLWASLQPLPIDRDNPLLRSSVEAAVERHRDDPACKPSPTSLGSALDAHTNGPGYPSSIELDRSIYLVSAEGGGIRAAYWTALNLARLDISTQGKFGEEVATLSGVSGGSLGIATWLAARDRAELTPQARLELITRFLSSDFLSPLVGGFLFLDVPRLLLGPAWPSARRDQVFEKALADRWAEVGNSDFFVRRLFLGCMRGFAAVPAVYYNATDAETGSYVPLTDSPLPPDGLIKPYPESELRNLAVSSIGKASIAQMVHISARFPYLSPEAKVGVNAAKIGGYIELLAVPDGAPQAGAGKDLNNDELWSRQWILVDGGYFDNTGLTPTWKALSRINQERGFETMTPPLKAARYTRTRVHVIHISNDPGNPCLPLDSDWQERLSAGARSFVKITRSTTIHCKGDVSALESSLVGNVFFPFVVPIEALLSVRSEQSHRRVEDLREAIAREPWSPQKMRFTELREISLAAAFENAFGSGPTLQPKKDFVAVSGAEVQRVNEQVANATDEIQRLVRDHRASDSSTHIYLDQLHAWQDAVWNEAGSAECHRKLRAVGPPLGWTLSKSNEALMQCLAVREAIANGSTLSPPPWPKDWPPPYPGVFAPSWLRKVEISVDAQPAVK